MWHGWCGLFNLTHAFNGTQTRLPTFYFAYLSLDSNGQCFGGSRHVTTRFRTASRTASLCSCSVTSFFFKGLTNCVARRIRQTRYANKSGWWTTYGQSLNVGFRHKGRHTCCTFKAFSSALTTGFAFGFTFFSFWLWQFRTIGCRLQCCFTSYKPQRGRYFSDFATTCWTDSSFSSWHCRCFTSFSANWGRCTTGWVHGHQDAASNLSRGHTRRTTVLDCRANSFGANAGWRRFRTAITLWNNAGCRAHSQTGYGGTFGGWGQWTGRQTTCNGFWTTTNSC